MLCTRTSSVLSHLARKSRTLRATLRGLQPSWPGRPCCCAGSAWAVVGTGVFIAAVALLFCGQGQRYRHSIWHLFVLLGTTCHFFAVLGYAA